MLHVHRRILLTVLGILLLAAAAPAAAQPLTLARTQSAWSHDVLAGQPLVVTWVLGNEGLRPLEAPLLVTTLAPGVTLVSADAPVEVRGRELALTPGPIAPGDVTRVRLVLDVPAATTAVDDGARAFATLGTRGVDAIAGPTALRPTLGAPPELLASTPDAPTDDAGVLRMIGRVGCVPEALFAAVQRETGYEVYAGALRGARGVLRTRAGNALDRASLLVALLRACGVPARWASGTLAAPQARALVESMFADPGPSAVGGLQLAALPLPVTSDLTDLLLGPAQLLPGAAVPASPGDDPLLLAEAAAHHWVEHGDAFVALDPSFPGAAPGDAVASVDATFATVPDELHHTVRLRLDAELAPLGLNGTFLGIADALATALGTPLEHYDHVGNVLVQTRTVLDATFTSVELVGQPLTFGQFVSSSATGGAGLTVQRNVYGPWLQVGDRPDLVRGTDVEETISTFASDLLTGLVLHCTVRGPDGAASEHVRELVDRIGYAVRREGGAAAVALDTAPVLTDADVTTVEVNVGGWDRGEGLAHATRTEAALAELQAALAALPTGTPSPTETAAVAQLGREYVTAITRYVADTQIGASWGRAVLLGRALGVRGYAASPRLTLAQARSRTLDGTPETTLSLDLRKRDGRAVAAPGRLVTAAPTYEAARGLGDAYVEGLVLETLGTVPVAFEAFIAALEAAGGRLAPIEAANLDTLDHLPLSADARARIRTAVAAGTGVLAPTMPAVVGGKPVTMWLEVDPETGETISVGENGAHVAAIEYGSIANQAVQGLLIGYLKGLDCAGCGDVANLFQVAFGAAQAAGGGAANAAAGAFGGTLAAGELLTGQNLPPQTPWEATGWIVGKTVKLWISVAVSVVQALQHVDPPLSGLLIEADALRGAGSAASRVVTASATFSGDALAVDAAARHHRAGGAAFYPPAVASGLGTGGDAPAINFAPSTARALTDAVLTLDVASGALTVGAATVPPPATVAFTGVTAAFAAADAGTTDAVTADGTFDRALQLAVTPAFGTAAHDQPLVVTPSLRSDADDTYDLAVEAPAGWAVTIAADGTTTLLPPPGVVGGTATVRFHARSRTAPALAAETDVAVDVVAPGTPRVVLALAPDPTFSVPIAGTLVPLAQRLSVTNLGAGTDTFDLAIEGLGAGDFTLASAAPRLRAGETAVIGLALHPGDDTLQPPGTPIAFTVRGTGRTSGLAAALPAQLSWPVVAGVRPRLDPLGVRALPGDTLPVALVLEGAGNAPTPMTLAATLPPGIALDGLPASVTLAPGEMRTVPLSLAVAADAPIGRSLPLGVRADLCNGATPCTLPDPRVRLASMGVLVGVPETLCLLDGTLAAALADLGVPAVELQRLALALSRLALEPADVALRNTAIAATNDTSAFLHANGLTDRANQLLGLMQPVEAGDLPGIDATLDQLCTALAGLPAELQTVAARASFGFTVQLTPSNRIVAPGEPAVYGVALTSTGTRSTTLDLVVDGLPAGVTAQLSRTPVTLAPGASDAGVTLTLASAAALPSAVGFSVRGVVPGGPTVDAPGVLAVRESTVDVAAVTPAPRVADAPGAPVAVAAVLANRANVARDVAVALRVEDATGTAVLTPAPVPAALGTGATTTVDLGTVDTSGLAEGAYTAVVTVRTPAGGAIGGQEGRATFLVGLPLDATAVVEPAVVPPGEPTAVVSRVRIRGRAPEQPGAGFFDQYAQAVQDAAGVADPGAALGVPDRARALLDAGGVLTVDLGPALARATDGPGPDLVVFERDACATPHAGAYEVAVADDPGGPFVVLGTASGARAIGDEFDLLAGGVTTARYVRITAGAEPVEIDAVLNAHPARPGGVQLEYHLPIGTGGGVANTPAIGDLDRDGVPEIAFNYQKSFVGCEMLVIDGATKAEKFRLDMPGRTTAGSPLCGEASGVAMANLDDDAEGEILVHAPTDNVSDVWVAMNHDGTELFRVVEPQRGQNQISVDLANLDDDPRPEILWPGGFRQDDTTTVLANGLFGQPRAVDVDGDGAPELVGPSGGAAFSSIAALRLDGTTVFNTGLQGGLGAKVTGRPAVADLDGDGNPDFAAWAGNLLQDTQGVYALRHTGEMLWSVPVPVGPRLCVEHPTVACTANTDCPTGVCKNAEIAASEPAVADVDGDGRPEVVVWLRDVGGGDRGTLVAFAGATGAELWRVEAIDPGGIEPSVSAADLDGDGDAEVLWNGSCDGFTIVDGAAGRVVYRDPRAASGSARDKPAVADADADGRLEVVTGDAQGLYVFGAGSGWASGRALWNQSAYAITNVNDDLSIPAGPTEPWRFHNTFHAQGASSVALAQATAQITHDLASGITFPTAPIVPAPSAVGAETVEWSATFPAPQGAAFDVPATVPALAPGETRVVSTGGRVEAELVLPDGTTVPVSIPLAPATVTAPHAIAIAPDSQETDAGVPVTFLVTLTNPRAVAETFALEALGLDPTWVELPDPVTLEPGASTVRSVVVTLPVEAPDTVLDFALAVRGDLGTVDDAGARLVVRGIAAPALPGGVRVTIVPAAATVGRGGTTILDVLVASGLDRVSTLALTADADDLGAVLTDTTLTLAPGAVVATRVTVEAASDAAAGPRTLTVTAMEPGDAAVAGTGTAAVTVSDRGVQVALSPDTATTTPSGEVALDATITNTGVAAETFALVAGGPLGAFATLGAPAVTLDPGAATSVAVTLDGLDAFLRQRSFVLLTATATSDPAVRGADASAVDVSLRRAVAVALTPGDASRVGPGTVDLALAIANTGNACDERYDVEVTSDPPGAVAAITPARFVVPPGQAANLRLAVEVATLGTYAVRVRAITDVAEPGCPPLPAADAEDVATVVFLGDGAGTTTTTTVVTSTTVVPGSTTTTTLPTLDPFVFYKVKQSPGTPRFAPFAPLLLTDAFGSGAYRAVKPKRMGLPADVGGTGVFDPETHLLDYQVKPERGQPPFAKRANVVVANACGTLTLEISKPGALLAPAAKSLAAPPPAPDGATHGLDHWLCYKAKPQRKRADGTALPKAPKGLQLEIADQFQARRYDLKAVTRWCTPTSTAGAPVTVGRRPSRPVPIVAATAGPADVALVCWRAKAATRRIEQAGCGPVRPGDRGTTLLPKQPKHAPVDPLYATSGLSSEVLASVKEAEVCLPSTVLGTP